MHIRNKIDICDDGKPRSRKFDHVDKLIVHRIGDSLGETGVEIAAAFRDESTYAAGSYTGGNMPYHFVIRKTGVIDQCLTLSDHAPHARRWNASGLAVAVVGDFRVHEPAPAQVEALRAFCGLRVLYGLQVVGHTELPGASKDKNKQCPGNKLNMNQLRSDAAAYAAQHARQMVEACGIDFR